MNKRGFAVVLALIVLASFVVAENETDSDEPVVISTGTGDFEDSIDKAYECLETEVEGKNSFSLQEAIFGVLALGNEADLVEVIEEQEKDDCWPKSGCTIKETSQVLLAYDRIGRGTGDIEKWILERNRTADELIWYLEIDIENHESSECVVSHGGRDYSVTVNEDMTVDESGSSCLSPGPGDYWLKIRDSCLDEEYTISCDKDFVTALIYQKDAGGTVYVSSEAHSAPSLGTTKEKINSRCFGISGCDYEGSLWAALALQEVGEDVDAFIPYLLALADDNDEFFPSAFLYIITGRTSEDKYSDIIQLQRQDKYWDMTGGPYNRYYDTALGLLALAGSSSVELENAKNYLVDIQSQDGCWNSKNIRDTGFLLYAGWTRSGSGSGGTPGGGLLDCELSGLYCESNFACLDGGGTIDYSFDCPIHGEVCCSVNVVGQTCTEKGGEICSVNEDCTTSPVPSADGSCCLGTCEEIAVVEDTCADSGGVCRTSCFSDEEEIAETCPISGDYCCGTSSGPSPDPDGFPWIWVLLLLILIVLVVIGIVKRDKLRLWIFKLKGKAKTKPVSGRTRPGFTGFRGGPPGGMPGPRRPGPGRRPGPSPIRPKTSRTKTSSKDKELEETLKKLRDMSK
jgi:hypothetical protein